MNWKYRVKNALLVASTVMLGAAWSGASLAQQANPHDHTRFHTTTNSIGVGVGGNGAVRAQLTWETGSDLDLHLDLPTGDPQVFYGNRTQSFNNGGALAELDRDNLGGVIDVAPNIRAENIIVTGDDIPAGDYRFFVNDFSERAGGTDYSLVLTGDGGATTDLANGTLFRTGERSPHYIVSFDGGSFNQRGQHLGGLAGLNPVVNSIPSDFIPFQVSSSSLANDLRPISVSYPIQKAKTGFIENTIELSGYSDDYSGLTIGQIQYTRDCLENYSRLKCAQAKLALLGENTREASQPFTDFAVKSAVVTPEGYIDTANFIIDAKQFNDQYNPLTVENPLQYVVNPYIDNIQNFASQAGDEISENLDEYAINTLPDGFYDPDSTASGYAEVFGGYTIHAAKAATLARYISKAGVPVVKRIDLSVHENVPYGRYGNVSHMKRDHVGLSVNELKISSNSLNAPIGGSSSFSNIDKAEKFAARVVTEKRNEIESFLSSGATGTKSFDINTSSVTGKWVPKGSNDTQIVSGVRLVIKKDDNMPEGFLIVTGFPIHSSKVK